MLEQKDEEALAELRTLIVDAPHGCFCESPRTKLEHDTDDWAGCTCWKQRARALLLRAEAEAQAEEKVELPTLSAEALACLQQMKHYASERDRGHILTRLDEAEEKDAERALTAAKRKTQRGREWTKEQEMLLAGATDRYLAMMLPSPKQ